MFDYISQLFFPEQCSGCGARGSALCPVCKGRLKPSEPIFDPKNAYALYDYGEELVQQAVWALKYGRKSGAARALTRHSKDVIMRRFSFVRRSKVLVLVPVPQHYRKTWNRGFNQSLLIARWLKKEIPSTRVVPLLQKTVRTTSQAQSHNRHEREQNIQHSMQVRKGYTVDTHTTYILIDDVITTGSTIQEASRALYAAGAISVYAVALAHGYRNSAKPANHA